MNMNSRISLVRHRAILAGVLLAGLLSFDAQAVTATVCQTQLTAGLVNRLASYSNDLKACKLPSVTDKKACVAAATQKLANLTSALFAKVQSCNGLPAGSINFPQP
jgi:hypothetical protein